MKPDWKDAPEWATHLAQMLDGTWIWFENEPYRSGEVWRSDSGRWAVAGVWWGYTLEARP